jgi:hypothetical protein
MDKKQEYLKHVVFNHNNKPSYPSIADLEKIILNPKERTGKCNDVY